jgi:hypothetical protein
MQSEKIQKIAVDIRELYVSMTPSANYDMKKHIERVERYDALVDKMVELTDGKANSAYTDPVLCDDYTALTGDPCNHLTYNELCESYGELAFGS